MIGLNSSVTSSVVDSKYSASFDGTDDYIDTNQTFQSVFVGDYSISFWMKPSLGRTQDRFVFSAFKGTTGADVHQVYFEMRSNGTPRFVMTGNSDVGEWHVDGGSGFAFDAGAASSWTHFLITVDLQSSGNSIVKIYVNGVDKADEKGNLTSAKHAEYSSSVNLVLGARNLDGTIGKRYTGGIDEFAIFNTVLDSDAAVAIYNGGSPLNLTFDQGNYDNSSALQAYYRMGNGLFDDKTNGVVHDQDNPGFEANIWDGTQGDDANWTVFGTNTKSEEEGAVKITGDGSNTSGAYIHLKDLNDLSEDLVVGKTYSLQFDSKVNSGSSISWRVYKNSGNFYYTTPQNFTSTSFTPLKIIFVAQSTALDYFYSEGLGSGEIVYIKNISLKKLNGKPCITSGGVTFSSDTP